MNPKSLANLKPPFEKGNTVAVKDFDKKSFEGLCRILCTEQEILDVLGFEDHKTLNSKLREVYGGTFEEVYPRFSSQGKASLRRLQWKRAQDGSDTILKWLGAQWLGQSDKQEVNTKQDHTIEIKRTIIHRTAEEFRKEERQTRPDDN